MPQDRPIYVVSDLHMGDGGTRDNFAVGDREEQLGLFLDYVGQRQGELIVLGDLFEFWQTNLSKAVVRRKPLLDRLAAMNATYVLGNHDADLAGFIGTGFLGHPFFQKMSLPFERVIDGKRFKFMHGHEVDVFNMGDSPQWGRALCIVAGLAEDRNGSPILKDGDFLEDHLEAVGSHFEELFGGAVWFVAKIKRLLGLGGLSLLSRNLTPAQNPDRQKEMMSLFQQDKQAGGYDIAIVGHTHQAGRAGNWYYNSGTWARKTNSFIEITPAGCVGVFDWADGCPAANSTVLGA